VGDTGLKLHFLGPDAKLRPFIAGGGAYSKSFMNFSSRIISSQKQYGWGTSPDFDSSSFLGYLSAGFDVRISRSISIGTLFRYYTVLTSRESNVNLFNPSAYGYAPVYSSYGVYDERQVVGGVLSRAGFYSVLAGVSFSF
jgi:hypothetical protein